MSEVDSVVRAIDEETRAAKASVIPQDGDNPDNAARALDLSNHTGVPGFAIYGDLDNFERNHQASLIQQLFNTNPHLGTFALSHPLAPKVAANDWHNLDEASEAMTKLNLPKKAPSAIEAMGMGVAGMVEAEAPATGKSILGKMISSAVEGYGKPSSREDYDELMTMIAKTPLAVLGTQPWSQLTGTGVFALEQILKLGSAAMYGVAGGLGEAFQELGLGDETQADKFKRDALAFLMVGLAGQGGLRGIPRPRYETTVPEAQAANRAQIANEQLRVALEADRAQVDVAATGPEAATRIEAMKKTMAPEAAQAYEQIQQINKTLQTYAEAVQIANPWIAAGKVPPFGLHPLIDKAHTEQARIDAKNLDEAMKSSQKSEVREKAPELYEGFGEQHADADIGISAEAIRRVYGDKAPEPEDSLLGWIPDLGRRLEAAEAIGGDVKVSFAKFVARMDPELYKVLREDVRARDEGVTLREVEEAGEQAKIRKEAEEGLEAPLSKEVDPQVSTLADHYVKTTGGVMEALAKVVDQIERGAAARTEDSLGIRDVQLTDVVSELMRRHKAENGDPIRAVRDSAGLEPKAMMPAEKKLELKRLARKTAEVHDPTEIPSDLVWHEVGEGTWDFDRPERGPGAYAGITKVEDKFHVQVDAFEKDFPTLEEAKAAAEKQLREPASVVEATHDFAIHVGDKEVGSIHVSEQDEGKNLYVDYVHAHGIGGANALGPRQIASLYRQILEEFPNIETISGHRVSGARAEAGAESLATINVRRQEGSLQDFTDLIQRASERMKEEKGIWVPYGQGGFKARIRPSSAYTKAEAELVGEVEKVLHRILGENKLTIDEAEEIRLGGRRISGAYQEYTNDFPVILWTLSHRDPIGIARHEAIHYLRQRGFFTDEQWSTLEQAAKDGDWIKKHKIDERYADVDEVGQLEEAIAEEFKDWRGRPDTAHVAKGVFQKLQQFVDQLTERIIKVLGYKPKADDLFTMIETGQIAKQESTGPRMPEAYREARVAEGELTPFEKEQIEHRERNKLPPITDAQMITNMRARIRQIEYDRRLDKVEGEKYPPHAELFQLRNRLRELTALEPKAARDEPPMFTGKPDWMTADSFQRWQKLWDRKRQEDIDRQVKKVEGDIRKRQTAQWKENEAKVREQVVNDVEARSDLAFDSFLSEGKLFGQQMPGAKPKLDAAKLTEEQKKALPKDAYGKDGLDPDQVAALFGYKSAEPMIWRFELMRNARTKQRMSPDAYKENVIDNETARRMEQQHGDLNENILREAMEHVVSDTQLDILHEETLAMGLKANAKFPINKGEVKAWVKDRFAGMKMSEVSLDGFLRDAGRAGRAFEAAVYKEDWGAAFVAKQEQYHAVLMADLTKKLPIDQFARLAKQFKKAQPSGVLPENVNFIHDILVRTGNAVDRSVQHIASEIAAGDHTTLADLVSDRASYGYEVPVADFLLDPNWRKPMKELTTAEFEALHGSVKTLAKNGRDVNKIIKAGEARDRQVILDEMIGALKTLPEVPRVREEDKAQLPYKIKSYHANLLQLEALFNRFDRADPKGVWSQYGILPLADAAAELSILQRRFSKMLLEADKFAPKDLQRKVDNPNLFIDPHSVDTIRDQQGRNTGRPNWMDPNGLPMDMTRADMLGVMLYLGRKDGIDKLTRGNNVNIDAVRAWIQAHATPEDWAYVQKIGEIYAETKTLADEMYRRVSGVAPEDAELVPYPGINDKGWYAPIRYSKSFEGTSRKLMGEDKEGPMGGPNFVRATTPAGYTKKVTGYTAPLSFSIYEIPGHINAVLHDIAMREAVIETGKLLYDTSLRNSMTKHYGAEYTKLLDPFLKDVAHSYSYRSEAENLGRQASEYLRQNVIGTLIGFNPRTIQKHTATAAMNSISEVGLKRFADEFFTMWRTDEETAQSNWDMAHDKFSEISRRHRNYIETLRGAQEELTNDRSWRQMMLKAGAAPVAFFDLVSAVPTALAEYRHQLELGETEGHAISMANRAVRRAHGSTAITNRPGMMRGGEFAKWMTSLYGFFNHMYNRQFELAWKAADSWRGVKVGDYEALQKYQKDLGWGLFSYVIFPAIVEEAVTPLLTDDHENFAKKAFRVVGRELFASVPVVRDLGEFLVDAVVGGSPGHALQRAPSVGLASPGLKAVVDATRDISHRGRSFDREHAGSTFLHAITVLGVLTGMFPREFGQAGKFFIDLKNNQTRPRDAGDWWQGVTTGKVGGKPDFIGRILGAKERK